MFRRPELRIKLYDFQRMIDDFTMADRPFTSYLQNKLEYIAQWYIRQMRPEQNGGIGWKFARVDADNDEVVFVGPIDWGSYNVTNTALRNVRVGELDRPLDIRLLKP